MVFLQRKEEHGRSEDDDLVAVLAGKTADSSGFVAEKTHNFKINPKAPLVQGTNSKYKYLRAKLIRNSNF